MSIITEENKNLLLSNVKAFAFSAIAVLAVSALQFAQVNIELLNLPPQVLVLLALFIGNVSNFIDSKYNLVKSAGYAIAKAVKPN